MIKESCWGGWRILPVRWKTRVRTNFHERKIALSEPRTAGSPHGCIVRMCLYENAAVVYYKGLRVKTVLFCYRHIFNVHPELFCVEDKYAIHTIIFEVHVEYYGHCTAVYLCSENKKIFFCRASMLGTYDPRIPGHETTSYWWKVQSFWPDKVISE